MFTETLSSIHTAHTLDILEKTEWNYLRASDRMPASLDQLYQVHETLKTVGLLFREMRLSPLTPFTKNMIALAPVATAIVTYLDLKKLYVKKAFVWLSDHFGQAARTVNIVSTALLFLYGRRVVATATFLTYSMNYFSEKEYFPRRVRKVIDAAIVIPSDLYFLVTGGFFDRVLSLFELASKVRSLVLDYQKRRPSSSCLQKKHAADWVSVRDLPRLSLARVQIDPSHLQIKPYSLKVGSSLSFEECVKKLNKIEFAFFQMNWEPHAQVILRKLSKDLHWNDASIVPSEIYPKIQELNTLLDLKNPSQNQRKEMEMLIEELTPHAIQFVKEGLQILVRRLKGKSAEVRDHQRDETQLPLEFRQKIHKTTLESVPEEVYLRDVEQLYQKISTHLLKESSENTQADALMRLAIEGGDYCGSHVFDVLREVETALSLVGRDTSVEEAILTIFYEKRIQYIHNIWGKLITLLPSSWVETLGLNSPHWTHIAMAIYGKELGAESIGSENDIESKSMITEGFYLLCYPLTWFFKNAFFSSCYTKENLIIWLQEEMHSGRLPRMQLQNYLQKEFYLSGADQIAKLWKDDLSTFKDETLILLLLKLRIFDELLPS